MHRLAKTFHLMCTCSAISYLGIFFQRRSQGNKAFAELLCIYNEIFPCDIADSFKEETARR